MIKCKFENNNEASLRHVTVDSLLIKRSIKLSEGGKWGLVGGFVDRDETLKEAASREAVEESGYLIEDIKLLTVRDNPDRPKEDRQNISFVYICSVGEKVGESDWEVDDQKWFYLDNIPPEEKIAFDHYQNIELYKKYLKENLTLPII